MLAALLLSVLSFLAVFGLVLVPLLVLLLALLALPASVAPSMAALAHQAQVISCRPSQPARGQNVKIGWNGGWWWNPTENILIFHAYMRGKIICEFSANSQGVASHPLEASTENTQAGSLSRLKQGSSSPTKEQYL